jgi:hypothetical protein
VVTNYTKIAQHKKYTPLRFANLSAILKRHFQIKTLSVCLIQQHAMMPYGCVEILTFASDKGKRSVSGPKRYKDLFPCRESSHDSWVV